MSSMRWAAVDAVARQLGPAFYVLEPDVVVRNYREFASAFRSIYPKTIIGYSYKTNYVPRVCSVLHDQGAYAEVVSEMEYDMALRLEMPPARIIVNGPFKSPSHVERCLNNASIVNLDSAAEVDTVELLARSDPSRTLSVGLRCNFPVSDTLRSRFGNDATAARRLHMVAERLRRLGNVVLAGLHCHFPNRDLESFTTRARWMLQLAGELFDGPPQYLDVGGGFFGSIPGALARQFTLDVPSFEQYANAIARPLMAEYESLNAHSRPTLILEPGTALVANAMKLIVQVVDLREVGDRWVATTTGTRFNMGLMGSSLNLPVTVVRAPAAQGVHIDGVAVDVAGYTCIEGDVLHGGLDEPVGVGDYLVFHNVGSYSVVFKPPFIMPDIAIIEWGSGGGAYRLVKRPQTVDDILAPYCD